MIPAFGAPWIRAPRAGARLRLFCLPRAGGGVADYHAWAELLPEIDLCPVALPGREARRGEAPYTDLPTLVRDLASGLAPLLSATPFALFGHSMGGWIAFELARELRRRRLPSPVHLIISARQAPQLGLNRPPLHHLPEAEFVAEIQRRFGGIPDKLLAQPAILRMFLPALRADFTLLDRYLYREEAPFELPISGLYGTDDPLVGPEAMHPWAAQSTRPFALHPVAGGHFYPREAPHAVCEHLERILL